MQISTSVGVVQYITGPPSPADNTHRTGRQSTRQLLPTPSRDRRPAARRSSTTGSSPKQSVAVSNVEEWEPSADDALVLLGCKWQSCERISRRHARSYSSHRAADHLQRQRNRGAAATSGGNACFEQHCWSCW